MSSKEYQRVGEKYCITVTINQLPVKFSTIPPFFIPDHPGVSFSLLTISFNIFYPKIIFKLLNTLWLQILFLLVIGINATRLHGRNTRFYPK